MAHYDLRLADCATFKADEIAKLSGHASHIVEGVFHAISLAPGSLAEAKTEETRKRRLATAVEWIAQGKSRNWKYERA